jgi:outer membrane receptor protein involved in Fe transport
MKRFITFILLFGSIITAKAQFGGGSTLVGKISGTVIDSISKQPMPYTTVALFYNNGHAPITGALTDDKGNFKLNGVHPGTYKLTFAFVGYPTKTVNNVVTTLSKPDKNMGDVVVSPGTNTLGEVNVTGQKALIENHIDKLVYNAEKDLTSAGGNAEDILQKVPLVSVDINGNVAIRGDQNVKVLINGRPSGMTSTSLSDALKAIPADQIKTIEVITSPSAKYDAEGSAGIINIVTKSKNVSGISGSFSGGVGTKQNNGNFNLNYNKNRFSLSANLSGNLTWPQTTPTDFNQSTFRNDTLISKTHYHATSNVARHAIMGSFNMGYQFNNYNDLTSDFRINGGGFNIKGTQTDNVQDTQVASANAAYSGGTMSDNTLTGFDWDIDFDHKFKKTDEDLDISAQWSHSVINTNYLYDYTAVNPNQRGFNNGLNNEYTLQADYTLPISKVLKLEAGGKSIFRRLSSDYQNFNDPTADRSLQPDDYVYDAINSNFYTYNQNVYAGYTVLTFTLPKNYAILAGGRFEETNITGIPDNPNQTEILPFSSSYGVFIPSLTIQKALNPSNTIKLSYSKRITRPSLQFLNPFLNTSTIQSETQGNPELAPEISQTIELNYNTFIKSSLLNFSVYYKHTSSTIEGIAQAHDYISGMDTIPATLTKYENIGYLNSWGTSFYGSVNPIKILTIRGSIDAFTFHPNASLGYLDQQSTNATYIQVNAFLSASVSLKSGFIAEAFAVERSTQHTIQGTNPGFYYYALGVRKQFDNKKASLGLNMVNPFSYYEDFNQNLKSPTLTQTRYTQFPFQSFGITFSYSFGKTTFSNPDDPNAKKKGVNNDDLKQGGGDSGGMGGGGR